MRNIVKALSLLASGINLVTYALMAVSVMTILSTFTSLAPQEGVEPLKAEINPSGDALLTLKMRNTGFLETSLNTSMKVAFKDEVFEDSNSVTLAPGKEAEMRFEFNLTQERMLKLLVEQPKIFLHMEVRTLDNLVGMGVDSEIGGIK